MNIEQTDVINNIRPNNSGSGLKDPNEPGISVEEKIERQRIWYEEREASYKNQIDENLKKRLDADAAVIKQRDDIEELKRNYKILENKHFTSIRRNITDESIEQELNPEKIIKNTYLKVLEKQAEDARKTFKNRFVYHL